MRIARRIVGIAALAGAAIAIVACGDSEEPAPSAPPSAAQAEEQQEQQQAVAVAGQSAAQEEPQQAEAEAPAAQEESQQAEAEAPAAQEEPQQAEVEAPAAQSAEQEQAAQQQSTATVQQERQEQATDAEMSEQEDEDPLLTYLPRDATHTDDGIPIIRDNYVPSDIGRLFSTLWGIRIIDVDELAMGAPRDAIPAIFNPVHLTMEEASEVYEPQIPLVQVRLGDDARGYPLSILIWHEIVNDTINGQPVAVTFCPLCNTAIAYGRQLGERTLDFAVSGLLRNSDLVMYDRNTETLWQQSTGRAIIGNLVGARLEWVPATIVSFGQFREAFPDGLVMSEDTGWFREYGQNPYVNYDSPAHQPFLYYGQLDDRLPPKIRVVSIETPGGETYAYPRDLVQELRVFYDTYDGTTRAVIFWTPGTVSALDRGMIADSEDIGATAVFDRELDGRLLSFEPNPEDESGQTFIDLETGSVWDIFGRAVSGELAGTELRPVVASEHFWFAWWAFHPETEIVVESEAA